MSCFLINNVYQKCKEPPYTLFYTQQGISIIYKGFLYFTPKFSSILFENIYHIL